MRKSKINRNSRTAFLLLFGQSNNGNDLLLKKDHIGNIHRFAKKGKILFFYEDNYNISSLCRSKYSTKASSITFLYVSWRVLFRCTI